MPDPKPGQRAEDGGIEGVETVLPSINEPPGSQVLPEVPQQQTVAAHAKTTKVVDPDDLEEEMEEETDIKAKKKR